MNQQANPEVLPFFDEATSTLSYIVKDPQSEACAIIDSVLDFDYASGQLSYHSADRIIDSVRSRGLEVTYLIETHVHADHLSAAAYLKAKLGGTMAIGKHVDAVQQVFGKLFHDGTGFRRDGSQFDRLFEDGETYRIGGLQGTAMHCPGHTPACMTHVIGDAAFVGDTLFMPDDGTARADFPGGDAGTLYRSIRKILSLPDDTRLFMCHDYQPNGRELAWETTVAQQRRDNIHVHDGIAEGEFVVRREARDRTLGMPALIYPALQVNMRAGHFPPPAGNGSTYLKVPISKLTPALAAHASEGNAAD